MRCVLHIGTEKTGTTIIQDWLYSNQKILSENGVYLSDQIGKTNNRLLPAFFHDQLDDWSMQHRITSIEQKAEYFKDFSETLVSEIQLAADKHHTFVITSEHFHSRLRTKEEVQNLGEFLSANFSEVKIVCYFRNQFDVAVSWYSTALKNSSVENLDDFIEQASPNNYYYNYLAIADLWQEQFGFENCEYKIYDRSIFYDGDIRKDFLQSIDARLLEVEFNYNLERANESLTLLEAVIYKNINKHIPFWLEFNGGINPDNAFLKKLFSTKKEILKGKISSKRRTEIEERFDSINKDFFRKYFKSKNQFKTNKRRIKSTPNENYSINEFATILDEATDTAFDIAKKSLTQEDANNLRDISLKISNNEPLNLKDALKLMQLAGKARPDGPLIRDKIKEWTKEIYGQK